LLFAPYSAVRASLMLPAAAATTAAVRPHTFGRAARASHRALVYAAGRN